MDEFCEIFREVFEEEISRKTGWGKNEIMNAFNKAMAIAVVRYARRKGIVID